MLSLRRALALGALHGPAELLPISSSGHMTAIPWLLGWDYDALDPELRKAFEVAVHAGTALALLGEVAISPRWLRVVAAATLPPAMAGVVLERRIERHAGAPPVIAAGLVAGAAAMLLADRSPEARELEEAGVGEGLWLGAAQAVALVPGVSRSGATLAAARWLGFRRADAEDLSRQVAVPVIAGATMLKVLRLARQPPDEATRRILAAGAAASFISSLVAHHFVARTRRRSSIASYAGYRVGLAILMVLRLRRDARARRPGRAQG